MIYTQPTAPCIGRLILPQTEKRTLDGQVMIEMADSGQRVPLVWANSDSLKTNVDMVFNSKTEAAAGRHDLIPGRLKDWSQVKPLESLAGARPIDNTWVSLPSPRWDGQRMIIEQAPKEVSAPRKALAQIVEAEGQRMQVRFFDPVSNTFDSPVVVNSDARPERVDLQRFEGQQVWLFGEVDSQGQFFARAIQPKDILRAKPDQTVKGERSCRKALNKLWESMPLSMNESHSLLLNPTGQSQRFETGKDLLSMHLFGGYQGPGGDPSRPLNVVGGHFAYGQAQRNEEGGFDEAYHQVYGQNPDGILSGKSSWDAYMGSFERGWLFTRPVVDMLIDHPALQRTFHFGGKTDFNFFQAFEEELSRMQARYRVGDGDGVAVIGARENCSQDSANALFAVTQRILELDRKVAVYPQEQQYGDFRELVGLARDLQKVYTPLGAPKSWQANAERTPALVPGPLSAALQVFQTLGTVLPRQHQESVAQVFLRHGAQIFVQQTSAVGAASQVETPQTPTRLISL